MTELEQRMTGDFDWAGHAPEGQHNPEHFGKLVAVHNQCILAVGQDRRAMVESAAKEIGVPWQHLVVIIVPSPDLWEIPH